MGQSHVSTRAAAELLACEHEQALTILRVAGVPCERLGMGYLWSKSEVLRIRDALREPVVGEAHGEG